MILPTLAANGLTVGGWFMMILSVGTVTLLFLTCIYKVLKGPDRNRSGD